MNEKQILQRKIILKTKRIKRIRVDRELLKQRLSLLSLKENLEGQMGDAFSLSLSKRLDCIQLLLEAGMDGGRYGR